MKKILILALIVLMLGSCSTYYGKYDYNRYFQNNEPYVIVDSEEAAAEFIARKLARRFRRMHRQESLSVLAFTDEYGDRINRGDFFARMIVAEMTRYNNPIVVERESLYELVKERELSMTNLIDNEGYELRQLMQADYILHGRILRGKHEDMISVRCFEVGTGQVVYASTVSIDYSPEDPVIVITNPGPYPHPGPTPRPPHIDPDHGGTVIIKPGPDPKPKDPNKKPDDGISSGKKIDLNDQKKNKPDNYEYKKKKDVDPPVIKKPTTTIKTTPVKIKEDTAIKKKTVKKAVPVNKDPLEEEKNEEKTPKNKEDHFKHK